VVIYYQETRSNNHELSNKKWKRQNHKLQEMEWKTGGMEDNEMEDETGAHQVHSTSIFNTRE
jgi:hypothetical protein